MNFTYFTIYRTVESTPFRLKPAVLGMQAKIQDCLAWNGKHTVGLSSYDVGDFHEGGGLFRSVRCQAALLVVEQWLLLRLLRGGRHLSGLKDAFLFRRGHLRC